MTWAWTLPINVTPGSALRTPAVNPDRLRVVIPTFRDWDEARATVDSLLECRPRPAEIVIANDNHEPGWPTWAKRYPVHRVDYPGNRGPSYARNRGATIKTGRRIDWLYFTDTSCLREPAFFCILSEVSLRLPRTTVAIAGPVHGLASSALSAPINHYMTVEGILVPPFDAIGPQAIVTANAAVSARAFRVAGGFDTSYPFAGGEDIDLGLRLRAVGPIGWAAHATVYHCFSESLEDFRSRFRRYGAGNAHLVNRWSFPPICVDLIRPNDVTLQHLADLQVSAMQEGYTRQMGLLRNAPKSTLIHQDFIRRASHGS